MKLRDTLDVIKEGKNVGKKNGTTAEQQAVAEAQSKHNKQLDRGYVTSPDAAFAGDVDEEIEADDE